MNTSSDMRRMEALLKKARKAGQDHARKTPITWTPSQLKDADEARKGVTKLPKVDVPLHSHFREDA